MHTSLRCCCRYRPVEACFSSNVMPVQHRAAVSNFFFLWLLFFPPSNRFPICLLIFFLVTFLSVNVAARSFDPDSISIELPAGLFLFMSSCVHHERVSRTRACARSFLNFYNNKWKTHAQNTINLIRVFFLFQLHSHTAIGAGWRVGIALSISCVDKKKSS